MHSLHTPVLGHPFQGPLIPAKGSNQYAPTRSTQTVAMQHLHERGKASDSPRIATRRLRNDGGERTRPQKETEPFDQDLYMGDPNAALQPRRDRRDSLLCVQHAPVGKATEPHRQPSIGGRLASPLRTRLTLVMYPVFLAITRLASPNGNPTFIWIENTP